MIYSVVSVICCFVTNKDYCCGRSVL